jgi:hypothetical protein
MLAAVGLVCYEIKVQTKFYVSFLRRLLGQLTTVKLKKWRQGRMDDCFFPKSRSREGSYIGE